MNYVRKSGLFFALAAAAFVLTGCSQDQVITDAEAAITAAEQLWATPTGLSAAEEVPITNYLKAAASGLSQAGALLDQGGSDAVDAAQITSIFAGVTAPLLPAGTSQNVVNAVHAVSSSLAQFLGEFATAPATPAGASQFAGSSKGYAKVKLSKKAKARAAAVKARADALLKKLATK